MNIITFSQIPANKFITINMWVCMSHMNMHIECTATFISLLSFKFAATVPLASSASVDNRVFKVRQYYFPVNHILDMNVQRSVDFYICVKKPKL